MLVDKPEWVEHGGDADTIFSLSDADSLEPGSCKTAIRSIHILHAIKHRHKLLLHFTSVDGCNYSWEIDSCYSIPAQHLKIMSEGY